jgi:hypothetical protein
MTPAHQHPSILVRSTFTSPRRVCSRRARESLVGVARAVRVLPLLSPRPKLAAPDMNRGETHVKGPPARSTDPACRVVLAPEFWAAYCQRMTAIHAARLTTTALLASKPTGGAMPRVWSHHRRRTSFVAAILALGGLVACSDSSPTSVRQPTAAEAAVSFDRSASDSHTRYVTPAGADVGTCTASSPCKTINYAVSKASAGDVISVARGTYHESVMVTKRLSLEGHDATIDATGQASPPNGVVIAGADAAGTSLRGFTVQHAGLEGIFVNKTSRITIERNRVVNNDTYGPFNPACVTEPDDCGEALHLQTVTQSVVRDNLVQNNVGGILLTDEDGPTFEILIDRNRVSTIRWIAASRSRHTTSTSSMHRGRMSGASITTPSPTTSRMATAPRESVCSPDRQAPQRGETQ